MDKTAKTKITKLFNSGLSIPEIKTETGQSITEIKRHIRKVLSSKMDDMWSVAIKARDGGCVICGRKDGLNSHHLIGRGNMLYRWDLNNGITLCQYHHTFSPDIAAHSGNTIATLSFARWLEKNRPDTIKWLDAHSSKKCEGKVDLFERYEILKKSIDNMEANCYDYE